MNDTPAFRPGDIVYFKTNRDWVGQIKAVVYGASHFEYLVKWNDMSEEQMEGFFLTRKKEEALVAVEDED